MSSPYPVEAIKRARRTLQFTYAEVAQAITADQSTLHRWQSGQSRPTAGSRLRLIALAELIDALERAYPDPDQARTWLNGPLCCLDGRTPRRVLEEGRPDLLTGILIAREAGFERALTRRDR